MERWAHTFHLNMLSNLEKMFMGTWISELSSNLIFWKGEVKVGEASMKLLFWGVSLCAGL